MGGALSGIPRSAAGAGVAVTVKANRAADPIATIRRIAHPSVERSNNTPPLMHREALITRIRCTALQLLPLVAFGQQPVISMAWRQRRLESVILAGPGTRPDPQSSIPIQSGRAARAAAIAPRSPRQATGT